MRALGIVTAMLVVLGLPARLDAQTIDAGRVKLRLSGRVVTQFNTTSVDEADLAPLEEEIPGTLFETRRVRFGVDVTVDDWITGRLEPEYAMGRFSLRNAYVDLAFDPRLGVRMGQFKKPFSLINLTSSNSILPIERGVRIRGLADAQRVDAGAADPARLLFNFGNDFVSSEEFDLLESLGYLGYDLGAAVHGQLGRFSYEVGAFNGQGADQGDVNDGKSFAGRVQFEPRENLPLALGAAASYRETRFTGDLDGTPVTDRRLSGTVFSLDGEWGAFRRPGLHLVAEAAAGRNLALGEPLVAAQGIVGYYRPLQGTRVVSSSATPGPRIEGIEPVFRLSYGDPSTERQDNEGLLVTPGVNLYFHGRNRLMLNWDYFVPSSERLDAEHALRLQAQVAF